MLTIKKKKDIFNHFSLPKTILFIIAKLKNRLSSVMGRPVFRSD